MGSTGHLNGFSPPLVSNGVDNFQTSKNGDVVGLINVI
jgi:hypothetical protein